MASAKPLVATNIPGYAGVMTNEFDGLMVPPQDAPALALAIVRLLADNDLRPLLIDNGRTTAESYAWPKVTSRVVGMYEQSVCSAADARWRQEWQRT